MTAAQEAQFKKVIDRLLDDNKVLRDLVGWQAADNERLREALREINQADTYSSKSYGPFAMIARAALREDK